jgi:hypothetical protein
MLGIHVAVALAYRLPLLFLGALGAPLKGGIKGNLGGKIFFWI